MSDVSTFEFDSWSFTYQFRINLGETKKPLIGESISSEDIYAGGHLWRINYYPRGDRKGDKGDYVSVYLYRVSGPKDVKAIFEAFVMDRDGAPSSSHRFRIVHVYKPKSSISDNTQGQSHFVKRSSLDSRYVINNSTMVITCGVKVLRDEPISVPPSNILSHLGGLLDSADGSDVSFVVDGEEFAAHRAVLIARSPVFKAQLLGSMADAKMTSITLQDIAPATFRVMLRYMYTDEFPEDAELVTEKLQDLFVAADRFALDRLKLFCAGKLWIEVSVDTVGAALAWAETYNCPELKKKCIDFLADEKNFRKVVLTDGFIQMVQKFPSVLAELRVKVAA